MRISDWSSDLCSSDLFREIGGRGHAPMGKKRRDRGVPVIGIGGIEGGNTEGRKEFSVGRRAKIGRASCRERVCQYVWITGVAVSLIKTLYTSETTIMY